MHSDPLPSLALRRNSPPHHVMGEIVKEGLAEPMEDGSSFCSLSITVVASTGFENVTISDQELPQTAL